MKKLGSGIIRLTYKISLNIRDFKVSNNSSIETKTIVYLGPEGSYTEIAADSFAKKLDCEDIRSVIEPSIIKVIQAIDKNNNFIGIVPVENSIEGIVRETEDNLIKTTSEVFITGEIIVPISHCLISRSKDISKITKVLSITQALAQCRSFLADRLGHAEQITTTSTSEAVRQLLNLPDNYAAIGSFKASQLYELNVLAEGINDVKDNLTRFVSLESHLPDPTGNDKTSLAFTTVNEPGALVNVLLAFQENNINLSYIESRPSKKIFGEYTFFVDFEGHIKDSRIQKTIDKISPMIHFYRFLGSYAAAEV
jgi:prephenate dehydratase